MPRPACVIDTMFSVDFFWSGPTKAANGPRTPGRASRPRSPARSAGADSAAICFSSLPSGSVPSVSMRAVSMKLR